MQLTGKLVQILPTESGIGKNGEWKKHGIVVETDGQYPKKVCFTIWGDKINTSQWDPGLSLVVDFDAESREFNGRWYTDLKAWKIEPASAASAPRDLAPPPFASGEQLPPPPSAPASEYDDLPF
jgi:hypothetical protein